MIEIPFEQKGQYPTKTILVGIINGWAMLGKMCVYNHGHGKDKDGNPAWTPYTDAEYSFSLDTNEGYILPFHERDAAMVVRHYVDRMGYRFMLKMPPLEALHAVPLGDGYYTFLEYGICKWFHGGVVGREPDMLRKCNKSDFAYCTLSLKELRALGRYEDLNKYYGQLTEKEHALLGDVMAIFKREKSFELSDLMQHVKVLA